MRKAYRNKFLLEKGERLVGMVVYTGNPSIWEAEAEGL
jgi:hypothetical protein